MTNWALMGGLGLALAACTWEPASYPAYGTYGGYYPYYPPGYYYGPGYGSFGYYNRPYFGGGRPIIVQPSQPPPPASSGSTQGGGGEPRGFLGNVLRQRQNQGQ